MSEQTKGLALRDGQIALNNLEEAERFAQIILKSGFAPKHYTKASQVIIAVQTGAELGLKPMQALQGIAVINGKPSIYGDTLKALVESSPDCEYVKEWFEGEDEKLTAWCEAKRKGRPEPTKASFSVLDARKAGLWMKRGKQGQDTPWITYPKRMLQMRARSFCLRDQFADLLCGLVAAEEAQDYPQEGVIESGDVVPTIDLDAVAEQSEKEMDPKLIAEPQQTMEADAKELTIDDEIDAEIAAKEAAKENEAIAKGEPVESDQPAFPF